MELDEKERAFIEPYLKLKAGENRRWIAGVAVGIALCIVSVVLYFCVLARSASFLLFVLGLVLTDISVDDRRKTILARILHKYDKALAERGAEGEEEQGRGATPSRKV